ncbi:MAG: diguanylate cyclase [Desulfobacteraceae bacterium]|nr:diguanylate cyclase [Desulfobacteraceae bacterium]
MARIAIVAQCPFEGRIDHLLIEARGHELVIYNDAGQAIERIINNPPDVVVIQKGMEDGLDKAILHNLKNNLQLIFLPVILLTARKDIGFRMDWREYPVDDFIVDDESPEEVIARIELAIVRIKRLADKNPLTLLPGNSSILRHIQEILDLRTSMAVCYADIDNFKPYNDLYGFVRGDEVIRMVARLLVNMVHEIVGAEGFVGHIGGDDFVFTVPDSSTEIVCKKIIENFNKLIPMFIDAKDFEAGYFISLDRKGKKQTFPLTSISIAAVRCLAGRYTHYGEVAASAAQLKHKVKGMKGSTYLVDRRDR